MSLAKLPAIVLGGNVFGWNLDEKSSHALLDASVAGGLNAVDTADVYSHWKPGNKGGESETIIGTWLKGRGRRDDVFIHTKGGAPGALGELANANLTSAYLTKAVEASLRRLQTDYIDLYYVHYDDKVTPPEETLGCFQCLMQAGKIREIAASNYDPARLTQSLDTAQVKGLPAFSALQTLYNLYDRAPFERELQGLCVKRGLKVLPYFSLARGFLSGKYRSKDDLGKSAARGGGVVDYLNPRGMRILDALADVARARNATSAQVALAWLKAKPAVAAPIASATSKSQLDDLIAAAALRLNAAEIAKLDAASVP